ncbi:LacI family DNA-binding transcriptional regulator [Streptococcus oricebi]|uniref:LacI family transcriptional regulator n=1 Tax=Streptococcus oricebi TaxID=1547447 RepID=A0ABS5B2G8_9STRE|nr:LacI family DNA-binding transcriptional regulator [Streptococcus oricebi]MBP2623023.1 LacI family transcriptional regulator [Streptococcus oricebi]
MASIREIAKRAGVAVATVSRVINHHPHVADETRSKVQAVIDKLGYVPNQIARDLSLGKTYKIGVVIPHTRHPYFNHLIEGLLDAAKDSDYQLVFMPSNYSEELEKSYLGQLRRRAIDGLIFTSHALSLEQIAHYHDYGQIVMTEPLNKESPLSSAYIERLSAYTSLFQSFKSQGYGEVVLLFSRNSPISATYQEGIAAYQAVYDKQVPRTFGKIDNYQDGYRLAQELIKTSQTQLILATSDDVAAGIQQAYLDQKAPLPSLIGQENMLTSQLLKIPTIDHKGYQLGKILFETALSQERQETKLSSEIIWR